MHNLALIIARLALITLLAEVADHWRLPYPVLVGMGLVPGLPRLALAPGLYLLLSTSRDVTSRNHLENDTCIDEQLFMHLLPL
jgi:hypothetical protein